MRHPAKWQKPQRQFLPPNPSCILCLEKRRNWPFRSKSTSAPSSVGLVIESNEKEFFFSYDRTRNVIENKQQKNRNLPSDPRSHRKQMTYSSTKNSRPKSIENSCIQGKSREVGVHSEANVAFFDRI